MENAFALAIAVSSATAAFIFTLIQKRLDFRKRRRSVAVTLFVEIGEANDSFHAKLVDWNRVKTRVEKHSALLVFYNDLNLLERLKIEDFNFPASVIVSVTRFHNSIQEYETCIKAINSKDFDASPIDHKSLIIDATINIGLEVQQRAQDALAVLNAELPSQWFPEVSGRPRRNQVNISATAN